MSRNRVIGLNNRLPWHMPADLAHFKSLTWGHTIVMGRKTFESIGKPLPERRHWVLTHNKTWEAPTGVETTHDPTVILKLSADQKVFVIGGESIYQLYLPHAKQLELTLIDAVLDGDAFFPDYNETEWQQLSSESHKNDDKNPYHYQFVSYSRI